MALDDYAIPYVTDDEDEEVPGAVKPKVIPAPKVMAAPNNQAIAGNAIVVPKEEPVMDAPAIQVPQDMSAISAIARPTAPPPQSILGNEIPAGQVIPKGDMGRAKAEFKLQNNADQKNAISMMPAGPSKDMAESAYLHQSGSGIDHLMTKAQTVKNPFLRALAEAGTGVLKGISVAGSVLSPGAAALIPGTDLHHQVLSNVADSAALQDLGQQKDVAAINDANAQAFARTHPVQKLGTTPEETTMYDLLHGDNGQPRIIPGTNDRYDSSSAYKFVQDAKQGAKPATPEQDKQMYADLEVKAANGSISDPDRQKLVSHQRDAKVEKLDPRVVAMADSATGGRPVPAAYKLGVKDPQYKADNTKWVDAANTADKQLPASQRADTKISIQREGTRDKQTDAQAKTVRTELSKALAPLVTQEDKLNEASALLDQGGAEGQAIGTIKTLSALASGTGSGVRITRAELDSVAHARGISGSFEAFIQKFDTGKPLTPDQVKQLHSILNDTKGLVDKKIAIYNDGLDRLDDAKSRDEVNRIDKDTRKNLMDAGSQGNTNQPAPKAAGGKTVEQLQNQGYKWQQDQSGRWGWAK